jgi:hypothetical protein
VDIFAPANDGYCSSAQHGHYFTIGRHSDSAAHPFSIDLTSSPTTGDPTMAVSSSSSSSAAADRESGAWALFNDAHVTASSSAALQQLTALFPNDVPYLLFYRRV